MNRLLWSSQKLATRAASSTWNRSQVLMAYRGFASGKYPPYTIMKMPALSPTMTQGNLGDWAKKIGEEINPGDVLVEIETDKATMDFESQEEGFIAKILVDSQTKDVPVNSPIAVLVENKEDADKFADFKLEDAGEAVAPASAAPAATTPAPVSTSAPSTPSAPAKKTSSAPALSSGDRIKASPLAKAIALEKGIDLKQIKGSGPGGRIVKEDVLSFKPTAQPVAAASQPVPSSTAAAYMDIPVSNVRKVIATRLLESKNTIPHFYLTVELDAEKILKLREVLNKESNGKYKLSVNDFVIKAASLALKDVPQVNSSWQGTFIRQYQSSDIAVAVATENGLVTPIVNAAETKGLSSISNKVKELAEKARSGKLAPHEYQGGTFTISNLGMFGIQHFTAIINPPHASILAVGGLSDKLVVDPASEKGFRVQKTMQVTLSNDHRVVDGAVGAQWLQKFKNYFENPLQMLL